MPAHCRPLNDEFIFWARMRSTWSTCEALHHSCTEYTKYTIRCRIAWPYLDGHVDDRWARRKSWGGSVRKLPPHSHRRCLLARRGSHRYMDNNESVTRPQSQTVAGRRWRIAVFATSAMFMVYMAFILSVAFARPTLGLLILPGLSLGIVCGLVVIMTACVITWTYILWANRNCHDGIKGLRQ
jgi:uncharacterized membrane protein (DUF485 family)